MDNETPTRHVTEAQLHRLYDALNPENDDKSVDDARMEISRIFRDTERVEDTEEKAKAEGFIAGLFFGSTITMMDKGLQNHLYGVRNRMEEPLDPEEAIDYLEANNNFEGGVIKVHGEGDITSDLYVHAPRSDHENADTPSGWTAVDYSEHHGIGFKAEGISADVDADKCLRELEGVETASDAVEWIHDNEGTSGAAHVSHKGPTDGGQPFVATLVDEIPSGWEYDTRTDALDEENYLRKT